MEVKRHQNMAGQMSCFSWDARRWAAKRCAAKRCSRAIAAVETVFSEEALRRGLKLKVEVYRAEENERRPS